MKKFIFILLLGLMISGKLSAQVLEAKVNRSDIPEGETFLLTVELKDGKTSNVPDFAVLEQDFTIYSVSNAYRTHIINGSVEQSQQWNLVLMPNKNGKLTIPVIKLDNLQTKPLNINVGEIAVNQSNIKQPQNLVKFKIEGSVDNTRPYVQQQINYTLTIYDAGGLQGEAPMFLTNNSDDWIIKTLGEPQINYKKIDDKNYREIKFSYALFPQKSGNLTIPAVRFNGYYLTKEQRRDPFQGLFADDFFVNGLDIADVFATRNPVQLNADPIEITVLPAVSENANKWWLPAEDVEIYAEFEPKNPQFKVGEAVSRNIYLRAVGVIDSQLPELKFVDVEGVKQYPEKPFTEMNIDNGKIVSVEKTTNVYIPNKGGRILLPEIKVDWYNVISKKMETAILPAQEISVSGTAEQTFMSETKEDNKDKIINDKTQSLQTMKNMGDYPYVMYVVMFVLGILLCLAVMKFASVLKNVKSAQKKAKHVIAAAKKRDIRLLRDGILAWAMAKWPNEKFLSLQDVDDKVADKEFRCELDKLSEALYAKDYADWNEVLFIRVFNKINKNIKVKAKYNEPLPKLYE
ncbi:MAG: protein BatD [Alphaproteobacteria bacterium]|nr:protein BatD [Alphaproteobacteria bacterium]